MQRKRRSGRIAKELPIVLLGTDATGKVFSEETNTVVLSRHGAGVVTRYRFSPDELLTLRLPGSAKEAAIRLVGQIGGKPGRKKATGEALPVPPARPAKTNFDFPPRTSAPKTPKPVSDAPAPSFVESFEPVLAASNMAGPNAPSPYSASSATSEFASLSDIQISPAVASATAVLQVPEPATARPVMRVTPPAAKSEDIPARGLDVNGRPVNKRRHVRIRVSFSACVRHPAHADEIVECENVSKGGVCFHSLQQYPLDSLIEVAAPFSPGETALFVPAQIKRIEPLSGGLVFRYGVEYTKFSSSQPYSQSY
jgi:hypothetical protein